MLDLSKLSQISKYDNLLGDKIAVHEFFTYCQDNVKKVLFFLTCKK